MLSLLLSEMIVNCTPKAFWQIQDPLHHVQCIGSWKLEKKAAIELGLLRGTKLDPTTVESYLRLVARQMLCGFHKDPQKLARCIAQEWMEEEKYGIQEISQSDQSRPIYCARFKHLSRSTCSDYRYAKIHLAQGLHSHGTRACPAEYIVAIRSLHAKYVYFGLPRQINHWKPGCN